MATKIESTEITQPKKIYVKSEEALDEMEASGQLEPFTDYYTDDELDAPFMPVGSIFISAIPITDARAHLLDGSTIAQDGIYANFANLIKTLYSAGNSITCTQAEFDADVTATGNCGKFVIDNIAGTIRLPKITTFIQGLNNITDIGSSLSAGLPNIVGSLDFSSSIGFPSSADNIDGSAITRRLSSRASYMSSTSNTANRTHGINFDASRNNQIYGRSDTVQPPATQYPYYIVLASGYKSSQVVEIDNIMNEVNSKITLLEAYPIGSIYMSTNSISPAQRFGGTWEQLKDTFLLAHGDTYTSEKSKTQSTAEAGSADAVVVSHTHGFNSGGVALTMYSSGAETSSGFDSGSYWGGVNKQTSGIASNGVSGTGKNMPPYLTVYMWKRVEDDDSGVELY